MRKNVKYLLTIIMLMALSVCMKSVNASAAAYARIPEGDYRLNTKVKSSMMLDVNECGYADGTNIQIYQSNYDSYAQTFRITHVKDGWHKICNVASGKALDVAGGSRKSGTNVRLWTYNGSDAQLWRFYPVSGGYYQIQNKLKCYLDVSGGKSSNKTNVQVYTKNSGNAQRWKLIDEKQISISQGVYKLNSKVKKNMMLDVNEGSYADGANIQIYHDNDDSMAQYFMIEHVKDGWYRILNAASNKAVEVAGGSAKIGTNVRQQTYKGTAAQLWRFYSNSGGYYYIRSKLGYYLDVYGGLIDDKTNVQICSKNTSNAQKWKPLRQVLPTGVTLDVSTVTLDKMGASQKITAAFAPTNTTQKIVKWSTSNSKVATVDKDGTVKAVGSGQATITASTCNGKTAKAQVEVDDGCAEISEGYYSLNTKLASNMVLDVVRNGAVDGANVQIYTSHETNAQKFYVRKVGNGWYELDNTFPRKCLDVAGGSNRDGANVQIYKSNGKDTQKWRFYLDEESGYYFIMNKNGRYLDVYAANKNKGANVVVSAKNGSDAQKWKLVQAKQEHVNIANGLYRISSKVGKKRALDVVGNGTANGTNIQIYEYNNSMAQMFAIKNSGQGWYKFVHLFSGKCLDVAGKGTKNGTNVQLYVDNGTDAQKWRFYPSGDGNSFIIKSKLGAHLCLDVAGGATKNSTNVGLWEQNGGAAQKWELTEKKIIELKGIGLNSGDFTLKKVGATKKLSVSYKPSNASAAGTAISWKSSNTSVAKVKDGVVTAVAPGSAKITAKSYNGKTAAVTVKVVEEEAQPVWPIGGNGGSWCRGTDWPRYRNGGYHSGTDIQASAGTPIYASYSGVVDTVKSLQRSYGKHVIIRCNVRGNTVYIYYCHMSSFANIAVGSSVKAGQTIGYVGSTGNSTGPHLHYEVRNANKYYGNAYNPTLNPCDYLPKR